MFRFHKYSVLLACLCILVSSIGSHGDEELEDLIDIFESNDRIIAIIEGKRTITTNLRPKEKVLWRGAKGYLGAFLTNRRFLVISTSSGAWQEVPLRIDESEKAVASMSPYIALLIAADRAIGFDAASKRFVEVRFPIHDELIKTKVEDHVAVVITTSRAFGLATETSAFAQFHLRVGETVETLKTTSSKAIIRTPDRLLTFEASSATWREHRLN